MQKDEKYVQGLVKPGKRENRKSGRDVLKAYLCWGSDNGYMDFKESIQSCQFRYQRPAL